MFAVNPGILAAGVSTGRTYDEFVTHITGLATDGARAWGASTLAPNINAPYKLYTVANETGSGTLTGSPWGGSGGNGWVSRDSSLDLMMRHAMPTAGVWSSQKAEGRYVYYEATAIFSQEALSIFRNGITSAASAGTMCRQITRLLLWTDGRPMEMQPSLGLGPEPYDW